MGKETTNNPDKQLDGFVSDPQHPDAHAQVIDILYDRVSAFKESPQLMPMSIEALNIPDYLAKDHCLDVLLERYRHLYLNYEAIIEDCDKKWIIQRPEQGYISHLKVTLSNAQFNLTETVDELKGLHRQIINRLKIIAADTDDETELLELLKSAQELLNAQLKQHLHQFAEINFVATNSSDGQFFQNELKEIILSIQKILEAKPIQLNRDARNNLLDRLLNHIGKTTNLKTLIQYNKLELEEVSGLVTRLFEHSNPSLLSKLETKIPLRNKKNTSEMLKEQIAASYDAILQLEAINFDPAYRYYPLKNTEIALELGIQKLQEQLNSLIEEWLKNFNDELRLFNADHSGKQSILLMIEQVLQCMDELKSFQKDPLSISSKEPSLIPEQANASERLTQLEKSIQSLNQTHHALKNLEATMQKKHRGLQAHYDQLKRVYIMERQELVNALSLKIIHTKNALQAIQSRAHRPEIEKAESTEKWMIEETKRLPLAEFKEATDEHLMKLNACLMQLKAKLRETHEPKYRTALRARFDFPIHRISSKNPFFDHLNGLNDQLINAMHGLKGHLKNLERETDEKLANWPKEFYNLYAKASDCIDDRNKALEIIEIIDARMQTLAYKTSIQTISALEREFRRIALRHIDRLIAQEPDHDKLLKFKRRLEKNKEYRELLPFVNIDKIDPRLGAIQRLCMQFQKLNKDYLNMDLSLLNDQRYFGKVKRIIALEMHNDHMEIYSESKRLKLIQWLRIYIIKPAMKLTHQNRFFVTPGATITERNLAEIGFNAFKDLENSAAPAA